MTCPHCSAQLVDDARFCPACGHSTVPTEAHPQAAPGEPDLVGRVIGGRFRVLAKLGEGGMGAVYRGEQTSLHRPCAIKLLKPEMSANQMLLRRFNAEAAAVAKLSHPNTVNIYDFGQDTDGTLFIAMELIDGHSLRKVVGTEAPLALRRALGIAAQIAASLADAHAHDIVHRDLKPDNVMVQDRGRQKDVVRVLDFGIAKLRDDSRATAAAMTQAGDMLGTPQYMAPEQIKGEAVDGRADIYALGCILYELVTARQPFEATTVMAMLSKHLLEAPVAPSVRRPDLGIPPEIDRLVLSAMQKDPKARPANMEMYGEQIAALAATMPAERSGATGGPSSAVQPVPSPSAGLGYGTPAGQRLTPAGPAVTPQAPSYAGSPTPPPPSFAPPGPPPSGLVQAQPGFTPQVQPGFTPAGQPGFYRPPQGYPPGTGVGPQGAGYPARPAMAMTAPQRPRSGRSMSIILVCIAAVVIAGGTVALGLAMQSKPGPGSGSNVDPQQPPSPDPSPSTPPSTPPTSDPWSNANAATPTGPSQVQPQPDPETPPPEPAEPQQQAQASQHAHSCEEVVRHYSDLMAGELKQQLAKMDTSQLAPYRQQIEAQLAQTLQSLLTSCQSGDWPDRTRDCILRAHRLADTARCM